MTKEICKCGATKECHLIDLNRFVGRQIDDKVFDDIIKLAAIQISAHDCMCLEYQQDNLKYLEEKAIEKGV